MRDSPVIRTAEVPRGHELARLEPEEAERPGVPEGRELCWRCKKALVPEEGSTTAETCRALGVCFACFDKPDRLSESLTEPHTPRKEVDVAGKETERPTCVHCGMAQVPDADHSTAQAARGLGLCYRCYATPEIRTARRKKVGPTKPGQGAGPPSPKKRKPKLLSAPRSTTAGGRKRAVARRSSPPSPVGDLRAEIGAVLKGAFATYAATELRAIADDLEARAAE